MVVLFKIKAKLCPKAQNLPIITYLVKRLSKMLFLDILLQNEKFSTIHKWTPCTLMDIPKLFTMRHKSNLRTYNLKLNSLRDECKR